MSRSTVFGLAGGLILTLVVTVSLPGQILIDDFNDGNDKGWTHVDTTVGQPWGPGIYDASSGAYLLQGGSPAPPEDPADGLLLSEADVTDDPLYNDGHLRFKVRVNEKNTSAFVVLRGDLSTMSGYVMGMNTELDYVRFLIQPFVNFVPQPGASVDGPKYEANQDWMFEAGAVGDLLTLKAWKAGDPEPMAPQISLLTDLNPAGRISVGASFPGGHQIEPSLVSAHFDDLYFTPVPEPVSFLLATAGALIWTASRRRMRRTGRA